MNTKIIGTIEMEVTNQQLGRAILAHALDLYKIDDPGVDYYTDDNDGVYMGDHYIGHHPKLATLIDAANYLQYGHRMGAGKAQQSGFFEPDEPLFKAEFTIENAFSVSGFWHPGENWNGWAKPWFEWETCLKLAETFNDAAWMGVSHQVNHETHTIYCVDADDDSGSAFTVVGYLKDTEDGKKVLYPYGTGYYIWSLYDEDREG